MQPEKNNIGTLSEFLRFLAMQGGDQIRVPALAELSKNLGVSISSLREQLEVARVLGFVEVKPKTGIRRLPYSFTPAVRQSLNYAIAIDTKAFDEFSDLRKKIEQAYWFEAVSLLTGEDRDELMGLVVSAENKLRSQPHQIPHFEHRELHLLIYRRLENPFVIGILEGYWELYESIGLSMIMDMPYLENVWRYHRKMVEAIRNTDYEAGFQILKEHMQLIYQLPRRIPRQQFE